MPAVPCRRRGQIRCTLESALYNEMNAVEDRHWWFRARRRILGHLLARLVPACGDRRPRLLDLGCGCGANLAAYARCFDAWGMDLSHPAAAFARRRVGARVCLGRLPDELPFPPETFDAVVMSDVLEHLDDDRSAVAGAMALLRAGGVFVATVPAGQWLFAPRDVAHHHRRRYARRSLRALFDGLPARVELLSHYHCALFVPAAAVRLWTRLRGRDRVADLSVPRGPINRSLELIFQFERHLLSRIRLPIGLSLVCAARKTAILPAPASIRLVTGGTDACPRVPRGLPAGASPH